MKLIKQSFEILEQKDFSLIGIKKFIERCGRVCYKSEDRITDDSYEKFVNMLVKRDHARPLEFGTVHLQMYISDFHKLRDTLCINNMWNDQWIKYHYAGNITYVTTRHLTSGKTRSCGCIALKDLTGQRFSKLTVIEKTNMRKHGYVVWKCKCDCGNITYVDSSSLKSGNNKSCGCLKKKR